MFNCTVPLCHQNQLWPPLFEQGHQEVTEHCPERPNLWSERGLIYAELEVDCP